MLSKEETNHYQRHLSLPGFGMKGQLRLKNSSALVVGAEDSVVQYYNISLLLE